MEFVISSYATIAIIMFIIGTLSIIYYSWWLSIKDRRYHGITRFFAFESLLLMILLNIRFWFHDPFCLRQLFSWLLLIASLFPAVQGYYLLRTAGRPEGTFENTSNLVKAGLYKYIRHPLYCSLMLLGFGAFLKNPTSTTAILVAVNTVALIGTAKIEEQEMLRKFGNEYAAYMKETKMFLPFLL
jgi:protein-S-isoprenylcysteine O-methyltransferase Ste14